MPWSDEAEEYRGRKPRESSFWQLLNEHFDEYEEPKVDIRPLIEMFRATVLKMLKDEGRLDDTLINKILTWRHNSGFSVHNEVRIHAGDAKGIENLAQYIIRNTFSPLEFFAAVTQHIPERLAQMVRYVGWYSNRMQGDRSKAEKIKEEGEQKKVDENETIVVSGFKTQKVPPLIWRECIKKVWEVDPLLCPHCGAI